MGGGPMKQAMVDAQGQFEMTGLKPGDYVLNCIDMTTMQSGAMSLKTHPVTIQNGETTEVKVVFGVGVKISGTIDGLPKAPMRMVTLRRPGGPAAGEYSPMDMVNAAKAARFQAGIGFVRQDNTYEVADVAPGDYILEVPRLPADMTNPRAYEEMEDRTPYVTVEVKVEDKDVELNLSAK